MALLENIQKLQQFNRDYAEEAGFSKEEVHTNALELIRCESEFRRIEKAKGIKPAVGVFGQSQCGKSYLVSELTGGSEARLVIKGLEDKDIMKYNQVNTAKESTALVTRITSDQYPENAPDKHALIKYMNPYEIMWSFVIGFYSELKYGKFSLPKKNINQIKNQIKESDKSEPLPDATVSSAKFAYPLVLT